MPYIEQDRRPDLDPLCVVAETSGELNFQLTTACIEYVVANGLSYQTINDVVGALTGARVEFYRRVAVPYEDRKIAANGDVYGPIFDAFYAANGALLAPNESTPQTGATDAGTSAQTEASAGDSRRGGCDSHCRCREGR